MKQVELLAPAGSYEALVGALNAGADAVYLGGEKFSARAYADNFSEEEILRGIRMAHIFGSKVYLTLNILLKEKEIGELYDFLKPLYQGGLDGVIVQDLGAVQAIRTYFPELPVHASTQMTITGPEAVRLLQQKGITRIVPARELSLAEIRRIKDETGVEVEAFIHGAMCYCYSGQCLFSSILGGRSGNRGRCAQPCRLPYSVGKHKEFYPLSMKDMCTLKLLPELIGAGIDSFKIEGRMKKPVYAAGVTAIYRKYIDLYYSGKPYVVSDEDQEALSGLYIRSEIGEGYYHHQNGREMITVLSPSYNGSSVEVLDRITGEYLDTKRQLPIKAFLYLAAGERARLVLQYGELCYEETGEPVQEAKNQPLTREQALRQLSKLGDSEFYLTDAQITIHGNVFVPVRELNELRRRAVEGLENALIRQNGFRDLAITEQSYGLSEGHTEPGGCSEIRDEAVPDRNGGKQDGLSAAERMGKKPEHLSGDEAAGRPALQVLVSQANQLEATCEKEYIDRIYLDYTLLDQKPAIALYHKHFGNEGYLAGPHVIREHNRKDLQQMAAYIKNGEFCGILYRNLETFAYFQSNYPDTKLIPDTNIYFWNHHAFDFFQEVPEEFYLPAEQNLREWKELLAHCPSGVRASAVVYGRLPMMITANCVAKTADRCLAVSGSTILKDRMGKDFPVWRNCKSCYNVIYNSVPLSLHNMVTEPVNNLSGCRMDFTLEDRRETEEKLQDMYRRICGDTMPYTGGEYTTGHSKRGVE